MSENDDSRGKLNGPAKSQPDIQDNQAAGRKTMGGKGHRPECSCRLCSRTKAAVSAGKLPWKQTRNLSKKQKAFINESVRQITEEGKLNRTEAAIKAGYAVESAAKEGHRLWNDPKVRSPVLESLIQVGVTRELLAEVVKEGLKANEVRLAQHEGRFSDRAEVPDYKSRYKFAELGYRLYGDLKQEELVQQAALFVQLPARELVKGHGEACRCEDCKRAWEELASSSDVNT